MGVFGALGLYQQHAPVVFVAQHVPAVEEKAPVLLAGQSQTALTELTAIMSWPATVTAAPLMKPTALGKTVTLSIGGRVWYVMFAPVAVEKHVSGWQAGRH